MAFTAVLCFGLSPALLDTGEKKPPAGHRMAHKRLESAGEYKDKGGHVGGPGGHKNPPQVVPGRALVVFKIFSPSPR